MGKNKVTIKGTYLRTLLLVLSLPAIIIWPFTRAYPISPETHPIACGMGYCCCERAAMETDVPMTSCDCRVCRLPKLPDPQDGLDHPDMSRVQTPPARDIEYAEFTLPIVVDHCPAIDRPDNVSNSPPLYILNSTFLI